MNTGKIIKHAANVPFRAADYVHNNAELAVFLQELLADGDSDIEYRCLAHG